MRLASHLERERLAAWILEILREAASIPGNRYLTARVVRYADELAALGADLSDPHAEIRPASAVAAHLLLTQAVESPLYNPAVPADRLPAIIANIRLGITRSRPEDRHSPRRGLAKLPATTFPRRTMFAPPTPRARVIA